MMLKIYSVRDNTAAAFLQPFYATTDGVAIRSFMDAANDSAHQFHKHIADYTLYLLGEFDDGNGSFQCHEPQRLMTGLDAQMKIVNS